MKFNQVNKLGLTGKIIVSGLLYLRVHHILCALGLRAYLLVWREEGEFFYEAFSVFPSLYFTLFFGVMGACLIRRHGGSRLACQVLPAIGAVSILELATSSGSFRMSDAPNLHLVRQLLNLLKL